MQEPSTTNYFPQQAHSKLDPVSLVVFLLAACAAWGFNIVGQLAFPSFSGLPFLVRSLVTLAMDILLLVMSIRLLRKNRIPAEALGLSFSKTDFLNFLGGIFIASASLALIEMLIYFRVPFHFERGSLHMADALKESFSFLLGNSLEELIFRGFLLLVLSRFAGWRSAILVTSLAFGLFHLQGTGINGIGLQMVASTATYSLIFGLACVLMQSLWTAISIHATSNILLHAVLGLDGAKRAIFVPVFSGSGLSNAWSLGALIAGSLAVSCALYLAVSYKFKKERERTV